MPRKWISLKILQLLLVSLWANPGSSIRELRELLHLQGDFSIVELQNVVDVTYALQANILDEKDLTEWGCNGVKMLMIPNLREI